VSFFSQPAASAANLDGRSMVITEDRVAYRGLLGAPTTRNLGALTVYVALESPFMLKIGDEPAARRRFAIVPPNVPHFITSPDRLVGDILIEPECVCPRDLQQLPTMIETATVRMRLESAFNGCWQSALSVEHSSAAVDEFFFGRALEPRVLDARIALAIRQIRERPCEQFFAATCAKLTGLSFSRFVHLFKEEIGMTFRAYCAWKRARALLPYVGSTCSLTDLAMQTGYPDSSHFSHSIRRIYGLRPKDILAGSRRLAVVA
jgi:AraC-like DNA-binding protein